MEKEKMTFDKFQNFIRNTDEKFVELSLQNKKILIDKENSENESIKSTKQYVDKFYSIAKKTYQQYLDDLNDSIQSILSLNIEGVDDKVQLNQFESIEECFSSLEKNSVEIKKQSKILQEYNFDGSKINVKREGEEIFVNDKQFTSLNVPQLKEEDFDTDIKYKKLLKDYLILLRQQHSCVEYILQNCYGSKYLDELQKRGNKIRESCQAEILQEKDKDLSVNFNNALDYYAKECAPIFEMNRLSLNDYKTITNFDFPISFNYQINIGSILSEFPNFEAYESFISKIDIEKNIEKEIQFPFFIDLTEKGNILINTNCLDDNVVNFVHQLILQFIASVPCKKLCLALVDVDDDDPFDFSFEYSKPYLTKNNLLVNNAAGEDQNSLDAILSSLTSKISVIKREKLSPTDCDNVFEYNDISRENTQELYLFVFPNCPKELSIETSKKILSLTNNKNMCGIFTLIVNNEKDFKFNDYYTKEQHKEFIGKISENSLVFDYSTASSSFVHQNKKFIPNNAFKKEDIKTFFQKANELSLNECNKNVIYLSDVLNDEYKPIGCSQEFKIPIGKNGGEISYFTLNGRGTGMASAVIAGGTGSGKSSFLHSIILSGAYYYSPDELEYYIIDFKQGTEFGHYIDKEKGIYIPHISFISMRNKLEDAYDLLRKIEEQQNIRRDCFVKAHVEDFTAYQNLDEVKKGKLPSFKRIVVIIDEYQKFLDDSNSNTILLSRKCSSLLTMLLTQIRNVGISLVLASQNIKLESDAFAQIYNRYLLDSSLIDLSQSFPNCVADSMLSDLKKEKGLLYKTENGGDSKELVKFAYSGKTNDTMQKNIAKLINSKYPNFKNTITVSGDTANVYISDSNLLSICNKESNKLSKNETCCCFGVSALSGEAASIKLSYATFSNYVLIGQLDKVRNIEASLGLSFIYNNDSKGGGDVYYLDLNPTPIAKSSPSPFLKYQDILAKHVNYSYFDSCVNTIDDLYREFEDRKKESESSSCAILRKPILLIINSFSILRQRFDQTNYSNADLLKEQAGDGFEDDNNNEMEICVSNLSSEEQIKQIYKEGYYYNIFVIIQDGKLSDINGDDDFVDSTRVICCDAKEIETCHITEDGESFTLSEMPSSYVVLFPDVSKVKPYVFKYDKREENFVSQFVKELKND